jgi:hypothetical protein
MMVQSETPAFADIEARIDDIAGAVAVTAALGTTPSISVAELLSIGEAVLEHWIVARGEAPTQATKEGFRLLALHRQGAKGDPSFNACRETCRELVYFYNLVTLDPGHAETPKRIRLAAMVAKHLALFVGGKMEVAGLGEFCCASKPLRANSQP